MANEELRKLKKPSKQYNQQFLEEVDKIIEAHKFIDDLNDSGEYEIFDMTRSLINTSPVNEEHSTLEYVYKEYKTFFAGKNTNTFTKETIDTQDKFNTWYESILQRFKDYDDFMAKYKQKIFVNEQGRKFHSFYKTYESFIKKYDKQVRIIEGIKRRYNLYEPKTSADYTEEAKIKIAKAYIAEIRTQLVNDNQQAMKDFYNKQLPLIWTESQIAFAEAKYRNS